MLIVKPGVVTPFASLVEARERRYHKTKETVDNAIKVREENDVPLDGLAPLKPWEEQHEIIDALKDIKVRVRMMSDRDWNDYVARFSSDELASMEHVEAIEGVKIFDGETVREATVEECSGSVALAYAVHCVLLEAHTVPFVRELLFGTHRL